MFSDLPNHPRVQLVQRRQKPILTYEEKVVSSKRVDPAGYRSVDVAGVDRPKFFCPIVNLPPKDFTFGIGNKMPRFTIEKVERKTDVNKTVLGEVYSIKSSSQKLNDFWFRWTNSHQKRTRTNRLQGFKRTDCTVGTTL